MMNLNQKKWLVIKRAHAFRWVCMLILTTCFLPAFPFTHPNMFLNSSEIEGIKAKLNVSPWKEAYSKLMSQANSALSVGPFSVTYGGNTTCGGSSSYCTEPFYGGSDRYDFDKVVLPLSAAVRDLGLAYVFSGDSKYADRAILLIRVFALDPATAMKPQFTNSQSDIDMMSTLPGFFYGADLIWNYSGWEASEKTAFKSWVKAFGTNRMIRGVGNNNFANWKNAFVAATGQLAEDQALLDYAFQRYKEMIPIQVEGSGRLGWEYNRSQGGLHYSFYATQAMTYCAEIARHQGVDLYNYKQPGTNKGLELIYDYLAPYVVNPSSWPYVLGGLTGTSAMEYAYLAWGKPIYLDAINARGRPLSLGFWAGGVLTLTHARGAYPFAFGPSVSTPEITPNGGEFELSTQVSITSLTSGASIRYTTNGSTPNANSTLYSSPFTLTADATLKAMAFKDGLQSSVASATFTITGPDNILPELISASTLSDPSKVKVVFSETLEAASAENAWNYTLDGGITVTEASLAADLKTVTLTVSTLTEGQMYKLTVNNVRDRANTPNTIAPNSQISFQAVLFETSGASWQNFPFTSSTGQFIATFDMIPNQANMNGLVGLSLGASSQYSDAAVIIRLNPAGKIDARNGGTYQADNQLSYTVGTLYKVRLVVDINTRTYSAYVTPEGSAEVTIGAGFVFRSEQATVTALDNWTMYAGSGTHKVGNFRIGTITTSKGGDVGGQAAVLNVWPNPFSLTTLIKMSNIGLQNRNLEVKIFNLQGKLISDLSKQLPTATTANSRSVSWEAAGLPSGMYLVKARVGKQTMVQKILLNR